MFRSRTPKTDAETLAPLPLLNGLTKRELAIVDRHTTAVSVAAGSTLCREGEFGHEAFIITSGEAEVSVGGVPIARLGAGDVLGEMALLECKRRSASVTATTPLTVLAMSTTDFRSIVDGVNPVSRRLLATLSERLRNADRAVLTR